MTDAQKVDKWLTDNQVPHQMLSDKAVIIHAPGAHEGNIRKWIHIENASAATEYKCLRLQFNGKHGDEGFLYNIIREKSWLM